MSFDSDTLVEGIARLQRAGQRRLSDKPLHAFVVLTPNNGDVSGLPVSVDRALRDLRKSNVLVTALPSFESRSNYWRINPPPISNPYFRLVLERWDVPSRTGSGTTLLDLSAASPANWNFLFFHELGVFGGELVQPPSRGGVVARPFVRTFFEWRWARQIRARRELRHRKFFREQNSPSVRFMNESSDRRMTHWIKRWRS